MPELFPPRQVHFEHPSGGAVATGWAMFFNHDTAIMEIAWSSRPGSLTTSYVPVSRLVPSASTTAFMAEVVTPPQVLRRAS